jgi:hypothetical protein
MWLIAAAISVFEATPMDRGARGRSMAYGCAGARTQTLPLYRFSQNGGGARRIVCAPAVCKLWH